MLHYQSSKLTLASLQIKRPRRSCKRSCTAWRCFVVVRQFPNHKFLDWRRVEGHFEAVSYPSAHLNPPPTYMDESQQVDTPFLGHSQSLEI
ncbi:hypothetical protein Ae201684P_002500 [Aphanomyces euteiches]|uniref:Uncharacterized protein n=1 Tax=Aphanomyces euteiches TaxID=100861 RepID=A0A6G0X1R0_9STRA|nr:hypothetical protein Ae201684_009286 [Aphanomyces euteiches]KAH9070130.1 hypothetical protein Ae201684P_002500 [Aphanomyces euteiches]